MLLGAIEENAGIFVVEEIDENGKVINIPTYFQIRNFLEIDMDFLLKNESNTLTLLSGDVDFKIFTRINNLTNMCDIILNISGGL